MATTHQGGQQQGGPAPLGAMHGGAPTAEDIQAQQEAGEFISNIMMEVQAHDMKQAEAMQEYMRKLKFWQRWSIFGGKNLPKEDLLESEAAAVAAEAAVGTTKTVLKDGSTLERSRASAPVDRANLSGAAAAAAKAAEAAERAKYSPYLFKKINPNYVPLLQRWWIPYMSALALVLVWSPDAWKLRTLYYCDWRYEQLKMGVHKAYWRAVMPAEDFDQLVKELEANIAKNRRIKSPDCPF